MKHSQFLWLLIAMLVLARIAYYYAQPDLSSDHLLQMAMAQNFMDGNGFSLKYLDSNINIFYKTNIQSPPLYPFMLALFSFVTKNSLLSSFIIQTLVLFFLAFIWKLIFNLFKYFVLKEAYFYFISLLIISTSILNNLNTILVFALSLLSASIYFIFSYLFINKSGKVHLFFASFFASLLFWTHYSYFLVAFYPGVVLFIIFYLTKNKTYLYDALKSFIISLVLTSGVLIYNYLSTGFINYMDNPDLWDAGFFPEHLLLTDPFFLNAFFKSAYLIDYLFTSNQHILLAILFQISSLIIFIIIVVLFMKLRKNKDLPFKKTFQLFIPFIALIVLTISFLLYFTLHYHEIPSPGWTHIGDPRYLSSVYLSLIAIVILLIFVKADFINKKFLSFIKVVFIILILMSLFINIHITSKEWGNYSFKADTYKVPVKDLQELYENIILELSKSKNPVFIDNELTVRSFRISQYAGAAVINAKDIKTIKHFPPNLIFFFILPEEEFFRDEDKKLLEWGKKYNLIKIGEVYNNLPMYKLEN